jgi:hypothetical protein
MAEAMSAPRAMTASGHILMPASCRSDASPNSASVLHSALDTPELALSASEVLRAERLDATRLCTRQDSPLAPITGAQRGRVSKHNATVIFGAAAPAALDAATPAP